MDVLRASAVASLLFCQAALCQEVVPAGPLGANERLATRPVLALRKLPADKVITPARISQAEADSPNSEWMVSLPAAVGSAEASKRVSLEGKEAFEVLGSSKQLAAYDALPLSQKVALAKTVDLWASTYDTARLKTVLSTAPKDESKALAELIAVPPKAKNTSDHLITIGLSDGSVEQMDANVIGRILAVNKALWPSEKTDAADASASYATLSSLKLDTNFANDIRATYLPLKIAAWSPTDLRQLSVVKSAIKQAGSSLPVATALLIKEGDADFGIPLAFTSKEKSLSVEPSLARRYDVYWVELAFSPSEELLQNVSELRCDLSMGGPNSVALDLVPAEIGDEEHGTDTIKTPTVTVDGVEVGEMFSRTVTYRYIRPTILSYGLLTPSFGWIFKGQSLDASAKRMFAVVGVPRGTSQIAASLTLSAKCAVYSGLARDWCSTKPIPYTIELPR